MTNRKFGALSSSQDPQKLAAWVTGIIISLSSVIALVLSKVLSLPVSAEQVAGLASSIGAAIGAIWFLFGLIRSGVARLAEKNLTV